ncbi:MAG: DEAD/DEAH box helicase, partial [Catalinimonas sp.]
LDVGEVATPAGLRATLRPYQTRGYAWLYRNGRLGLGSIIADDMGLGKTLQVIALLLKHREEGRLPNGALVVVPTTLLTNWQHEIDRFAPALATHLYHGPARHLPTDRPDVLLTTYGVARVETERLSEQPWDVLVIDEAQNIKNPTTAQTKALKRIPAHTRVAMSGTPVENRLSEYWSLMDFVNRGYLGSLKRFQCDYAYPIEVEQDQRRLDRFRRVTTPFLLRRVKSDRTIISDLPDKIETDAYCHLTAEQAALYQGVVDEIMAKVERADGIERRGLIFQLTLLLKQVCNHPSQFARRPTADPAHSGKSQRLLELLGEVHERGEKALVFTQFRQMGDLLQPMIAARHATDVRFLHGGCSRRQRDQLVKDFQNDPAVRTMILSLKAGGTGLNLTAANHVVHYDLWWNPAVEAQATDRAYRIGQRRHVLVHRLLTTGTFEEKINDMLREKRALADLAVAQGEQWIGDLSNRDLKQLFTLA